MRAAVYNRHLATMGGGERYTGMLAAVLTQDFDEVDLVGHGEGVTLEALQQHLGIDLAGVRLRLVPDVGEEAVAELSADYDLFVNASYMSRVRSQARHGSYAVYFPTPWDHDLTRLQKLLSRRIGPYVRSVGTPFEYGHGWFPPAGGRRRSWSWTGGDAELRLGPGPAREMVVQVGRPAAPAPCTLTVLANGEQVAELPVRPGAFTTHHLRLPASAGSLSVRFVSDTFAPPPPDQRQLGVAVSRVFMGGSRLRLRERLGYRLPYLRRDPDNLSFLDSYDQVVSISEYTREWVRRYWDRDSELLFPPVHTSAVPAGAKRDQVLSVGRFFGQGRGHSKKQLEMVQAFVAAQDRGELQGWEYHLVGGCSEEDLPYLEQVRAAGAGHAVHVHANAPRALVSELFATSKLFWHATGLGEHPEDAPWVFEHFGITTVEAMAAGCVPVVIAMAGQKEIVRDGVDGFLFTTLQQLQERSALLAKDEALRSKLAAAATVRAGTFSEHAFAERWSALVRELEEPRR
ncbi:MAG: glycosyltransferase [Nocardioidaceae bacterium]